MPDSTLANLTAATAATGGLFYGTQSSADKKFTLTAAGAALIEAANAAAQITALGAVASGGALGTPSSGTLTNCTGLPTDGLVDDAVTLAKMAAGTAGNLISYDASGNPVAVATGTAGQVLTSNGAGLAPTMQTAAGGSSGYTVKTASYTAVAGDKISADTSGGAFTITLPASPSAGDTVEIIAAKGSFIAGELTIERNGQNIDNASANAILSQKVGVQFVFISSYGWRSYATNNDRSRLDLVYPSNQQYGFSVDAITNNFDIYKKTPGSESLVARINNSLATFYSSEITINDRIRVGTGNGVCFQFLSTGVARFRDFANIGIITEYGQVASGGTPSTNSARIYSKDVSGTAEMFVMDEAGNETQISPHNTAAPESLVDSPFDEIGYTANYYTGIITYTNKQRQISNRADAQFFETFEEHKLRTGTDIAISNWDTVQADHVAKREEEREAWATRKAEWEANPENEDKPFADPEPEVFTAKPIPTWLADQLAGKEAFLAARHPAGKSWPSKAEFWAEFTDTEKVAILTSTDLSVRMLDKELTMWTGIVLASDSRIVAGLDKLVELDIITEARKTEIITI